MNEIKLLILLVVVLYVTTFIDVCKHCEVGALGYPDEWDSKKHEVVYNVQVIVSIILTRREQEIPHLYRWRDELR